MERVDADEIKMAEIAKHPIGVVILYIQAVIGLSVAAFLAYFLTPVVVTNSDDAFFYATLFMVGGAFLTVLVLAVATFIYFQNRLIMTDRNITQILQYGLFNRKVSQLNISNVEDVTALQNGVLQTMFNYGTLKIETAGEQMNFNFTNCPSPGHYAKIILDAREKMLGQMEHDDPDFHRNNDGDRPVGSETNTNQTLMDSIKDLGAETLKQASNK